MGRLIPAHAGKTTGALVSTSALKAHPRSRGENSLEVWREALVAGSSPLTRGKQSAGGCAAGSSRLIPAHAGKTLG